MLSNQCKEIEGNNRMGKTRDLLMKTEDKKKERRKLKIPRKHFIQIWAQKRTETIWT